MNINYKFYILFVILFVGLVSCATNSEKLETGGFRWKVPFDGSDSEPVVYNGTIYIASLDGAIYAINPNNGKQIWRYQTGEDLPRDNVIYTSDKSFGGMLGTALDAVSKKSKGRRQIVATPVIEDGVVYVGSKDHSFYALDAQSGKLKWATDIGHPVFKKATLTKSNIIVHGIGMGLSPNAVYVLRKANGEVAWSTEGKGSATYPYFEDNTLYYALSEKEHPSFFMYAVEENTGDALWTLELQGHHSKNVYGKVYGSDGLVYVSAYKKEGMVPNARNNGFYMLTTAYVYAINAPTGKLAWEFKGGHGSPLLTIGSKYIYFTSSDGLYALDKSTGKLRWFLESPGTPPWFFDGRFSVFNIVESGFLYVNGNYGDNNIYAVDPQLGKIIWNYEDGNLFHTKVIDDVVYVSAGPSQIAINANTGKVLWRFETDANVSTTPLIFKNHVIFPTETNNIMGKDDIQGYLYSIDARTEKVK